MERDSGTFYDRLDKVIRPKEINQVNSDTMHDKGPRWAPCC
jgi:hypothetical protein